MELSSLPRLQNYWNSENTNEGMLKNDWISIILILLIYFLIDFISLQEWVEKGGCKSIELWLLILTSTLEL